MHKKDNAPFPKATPASYASDQRQSTLCAKSFFACRVTGLKIPSTSREPSAEHGAGKDSTHFPKAMPASYASDQRHSTLCAKSFFACRVTGSKIPSTPREPTAEHGAGKDSTPFPKAMPASYASDQRHSTLCARSFFACRVTGLKIPSTPREPSAEHGAGKDSTPFPKATPASYASDQRHSTLCAKSFPPYRLAFLPFIRYP